MKKRAKAKIKHVKDSLQNNNLDFKKYLTPRNILEIIVFLFVPIIRHVVVIIWGKKLKKTSYVAGQFLMLFGAFFLALGILFTAISMYANSLEADVPLAFINSNSMGHKVINSQICGKGFGKFSDNLRFTEWWSRCGEYYETNFGITKNQYRLFDFHNGINKGDLVILEHVEAKNIRIGDVIAFAPGDDAWHLTNGFVVHRVIKIYEDYNGNLLFQTKGDSIMTSVTSNNFETNIKESQIQGRVKHVLPHFGIFKYNFH